MTTVLNFPEFQATCRECADLGVELSCDFGQPEPVTGFLYADGCYIESNWKDSPQLGKYHLLIERSEWFSDDLAKLERILWAQHYLLAGETDYLLAGATDFNFLTKGNGSLDDYIAGLCDAFGIECDGDAFGVLFSGKDQWSVGEAHRIVTNQLWAINAGEVPKANTGFTRKLTAEEIYKTALEAIAKRYDLNDGEPEAEDYDDTESAYYNGLEVANYESAKIASDALKAGLVKTA